MSEKTTTATVMLRNGHEHVELLVTVTLMSLRALMEENPIAFYEFVSLCRNRDHVLFGNTEEILRDRSLLDQPAIREITLAATEGELLEMRMVNPLAAG